jgi:TusA-related sulfurtransferase
MSGRHIDMRGRACPVPIIELARALRDVPPGDSVEMKADDRSFPCDVAAWCKKTGNALLSLQTEGLVHIARVQRARSGP